MLTVSTKIISAENNIVKTMRVKDEKEKKMRLRKIRKFIYFMEECDPDFIFLPAFYIAKKFKEEGKKLDSFRNFFYEKCSALEIREGRRRAKIFRLSLKLIEKH